MVVQRLALEWALSEFDSVEAACWIDASIEVGEQAAEVADDAFQGRIGDFECELQTGGALAGSDSEDRTHHLAQGSRHRPAPDTMRSIP